MNKEITPIAIATAALVVCAPAMGQPVIAVPPAVPPHAAGPQIGPPPAPPSPTAKAAIKTLESVCLPLLHGEDLRTTSRAAGFQDRDGLWVLTIQGDWRVELEPPDNANPHLCGATIYAASGGDADVRTVIDRWARSQGPPLSPVKVDQSAAGPTHTWTTSTWSGQTTSGVESLVLSQEPAAPGRPGGLDRSNLMISLAPT